MPIREPHQHQENDWSVNRKYVMEELERLGEKHQDIRAELQELAIAVAVLQVKAGIWGALAGVVVTIGALLLGILKQH